MSNYSKPNPTWIPKGEDAPYRRQDRSSQVGGTRLTEGFKARVLNRGLSLPEKQVRKVGQTGKLAH